MPPKTVTCCICGEEVSKRQSLETSPGKRACRGHKETQRLSTKLQNFQKETEEVKQVKRDKIKRDNRIRDIFIKKNFFGDFILKCYCCSKEGIRSDIWAQRALINMHKKKLLGEKQQNAFDVLTESFKRDIGGVPLIMLSCEHKIINDIRVSRHYVEVKEFGGIILLCDDCLKIKKVPDELYKPSVKQTRAMANIVPFMKEDLNKLAQEEIDNDGNTEAP